MANLIYQHRSEGHGIYLSGASKPATSHVICGNCIMGVQVCARWPLRLHLFTGARAAHSAIAPPAA